MSITKGVNEAHYHDPTSEASQEHLGDQVMEKMASPWKRRSLSPNGGKLSVQARTLVVMGERERVGFIGTSNSTRLFLSFSVKSLCRTQPVAEDAQETNGTVTSSECSAGCRVSGQRLQLGCQGLNVLFCIHPCSAPVTMFVSSCPMRFAISTILVAMSCMTDIAAHTRSGSRRDPRALPLAVRASVHASNVRHQQCRQRSSATMFREEAEIVFEQVRLQ